MDAACLTGLKVPLHLERVSQALGAEASPVGVHMGHGSSTRPLGTGPLPTSAGLHGCARTHAHTCIHTHTHMLTGVYTHGDAEKGMAKTGLGQECRLVL